MSSYDDGHRDAWHRDEDQDRMKKDRAYRRGVWRAQLEMDPPQPPISSSSSSDLDLNTPIGCLAVLGGLSLLATFLLLALGMYEGIYTPGLIALGITVVIFAVLVVNAL